MYVSRRLPYHRSQYAIQTHLHIHVRVEIYSYSRIRRSHRKNLKKTTTTTNEIHSAVCFGCDRTYEASLIFIVCIIFICSIPTDLSARQNNSVYLTGTGDSWCQICEFLGVYTDNFGHISARLIVILVIESGMERIGLGENCLLHVHFDIAAFKARQSKEFVAMCWQSLRINSSSISRVVSVHIYILTKERAVITLDYTKIDNQRIEKCRQIVASSAHFESCIRCMIAGDILVLSEKFFSRIRR